MSSMPGGKEDNKPNEENVPFVMRLGNEGLRIISKMRRINYMVRIHRSFAEWVRDWKSEKAKAREYQHPCNITPSISETFCHAKVSTAHDCNELKSALYYPLYISRYTTPDLPLMQWPCAKWKNGSRCYRCRGLDRKECPCPLMITTSMTVTKQGNMDAKNTLKSAWQR